MRVLIFTFSGLIGILKKCRMTIKTPKFSNNLNTDFVTTLRANVNAYFEEKNISKYGNFSMVVKTIFMFAVFFVPYVLMVTNVVTHPLLLFLLWVVLGFGTAGIGLSIMHDANHRSYSKRKWVNKLLSYSLSLLGGAPVTWQYQHNTLHHSFTNIDDLDQDINPVKILRFSPNRPKYKIHRFQHLYAWFFYGLMTLTWSIDKDFRQIHSYKKNFPDFTKKRSITSMYIELIFTKILYYGYMLVIPIIFLPIPWWLILVFYFTMHFTCGIILGIIFQTAHVMPTSKFPKPSEDGTVENNWAIHQLQTTSNYSPKSKLFSWLIGGLNYQVEHHLFPRICHVHYHKISKIVKQTAENFQIPYYEQKNFGLAILNHGRMLKSLGRQ